MRALMDRFPGMGPSMNRMTGVKKTMLTVAEFREREARLAAEEGDEAAGRGPELAPGPRARRED